LYGLYDATEETKIIEAFLFILFSLSKSPIKVIFEKVLMLNNSSIEERLLNFTGIVFDIPALNTLELSKFNKDTKKSERPIDKAVKLGKMLQGNQRCKDNIGEIVGKYETFTDFYADRNDQKLLLETVIS